MFPCLFNKRKIKAVTLCFIRESYFVKNSTFTKMLDCGNSIKQSQRTYLCLQVVINDNCYYIPLRNNLGEDIRKFGRIGHSVPTNRRCNAGLDYRHTRMVNKKADIEFPNCKRIPQSQINIIENDYIKIENEFSVYLNGFIKNAKKNRIDKEPLYRESCLINFLDLLIQKDHY